MTDTTDTPQPDKASDHLSKDEAFQTIQELRDEHSFDTSTDDQDEP